MCVYIRGCVCVCVCVYEHSSTVTFNTSKDSDVSSIQSKTHPIVVILLYCLYFFHNF